MTVLTAQLEKLLKNARLINDPAFQEVVHDNKDLFAKHAFRLRPSVGSISLVSCASATPQLGFPSIGSATGLKKKLAALRKGDLTLEGPGRNTPEKFLQSWLISEAMNNGRRLQPIEGALNDQHSYLFVTDEIALKASNANPSTGKTPRVVADLLVLRLDGRTGESELVNVELKSERSTETHRQIKASWGFIGPDERNLWHELADTMLGGERRTWKKADGNRGIVIWPRRKAATPSAQTAKLMTTDYRGIETIGYSGPPYGFELERFA